MAAKEFGFYIACDHLAHYFAIENGPADGQGYYSAFDIENGSRIRKTGFWHSVFF
jgi:hypothetical protein